MTIEEEVANQAPTADANGPYSAQVGDPITFDGSGSMDDGTIVAYEWDFGDGSTGLGVNPTHTYGAAGTFTITLTVTDDGTPALSGSATTTATITDVPPPTGDKVSICNKGKNTISVNVAAVKAHLGHGDTLGPCNDNDGDSDDDRGNGNREAVTASTASGKAGSNNAESGAGAASLTLLWLLGVAVFLRRRGSMGP